MEDGINVLGIQETLMTHMDLFEVESMWWNFQFFVSIVVIGWFFHSIHIVL